MLSGGYWSTYWYNGNIYGSEIARGIDIFKLTPSEFLSQNEIDAAMQFRLQEFNSQNHFTPLIIQQERSVGESKSDILQGTLDLMVLKTLDAMGSDARLRHRPPHRAAQRTRARTMDQGTVYLCLIRLVQKGWVDRRLGHVARTIAEAKFYATLQGRASRQLAAETQQLGARRRRDRPDAAPRGHRRG